MITNVIDRFKKSFLNEYDKDFGIFIKHGTKFVSANIFSVAVSFLAIPIYTRFLTPSDYGTLAVFHSALGIFSIIYGLQMYGSVSRYYLEKTDDFPDFLGANLIALVIIIFVEGLIFWVFRVPIMKFFSVPLSLFPFLIAISIVSFGFSIHGTLLAAKRHSSEYTLISMLKVLFLFLIAVILMYHMKSEKYLGVIYAQTFVTFIVWVYCMFKLLPQARINFKIEHIRYSINYNLPAIPGALSSFILAFFDRVIINQLTNPTKTGLYSLAYNIAMVLGMIYSGLFATWVPTFIEDMKDKRYGKIQILTSRFSDIVFFIALLIALFSSEIIHLMSPAKYHAALNLIPIIVLGYAFLYIANVYAYFASYRKEKIIVNSMSLLAVVGINVALNYLLIPRFGYTVAAATTTFSYILLMFFYYLNVRYLLKEDVLPLRMFLLKLIFALMFFILLSGVMVLIKGKLISVVVRIVAILTWGYFVFVRQIFLRSGLIEDSNYL